MRAMCGHNQVFGVEDGIIPFYDVFYAHRVHMMDDNTIVNLITFDTEV